MAREPEITFEGNLTKEPDLKFTKNGEAVVNFDVASTPSYKQGNDWVDGETIFFRCTAWKQHAVNIAESLTKGTSVHVRGRLKQEAYDGKDGSKRTQLKVEVEYVGPVLKFASVEVSKNRDNGSFTASKPSQDDSFRSSRTKEEPPF